MIPDIRWKPRIPSAPHPFGNRRRFLSFSAPIRGLPWFRRKYHGL